MLSFLYRSLTDLGAPAISFYLAKRRREGREDPERFTERLGQASLPRPRGRLIWCHAASVGEAASLLTLIEKISETYPDTHMLITTGTVTSARMLEGRLPNKTIHQYVPVDRMPYVRAFLDHWQPDFVLWIESELWPNMLAGLRERWIPAVLLNGRMSEKSFHNWYKVKGWAKEIFSTFALCLTQTEDERSRFVALGAKPVKCLGNLKYAAKPLAVDEEQLTQLKQMLAGRLCWVMASTHRGEEDMALAAHKSLIAKWPNLLTIIIPRHAVRGEEIAQQMQGKISFARRSKGEDITAQTGVYLADTMGELGLFYRLCPIACIGGSFIPTGGHNPIEPAQLGCAILLGPYMHNFSEITREFTQQQAARQIQNANEMSFVIDRLLADPIERTKYAQNARRLADQKSHVLDQILEVLEPWLKPTAQRAA
jgi:3-deoxy-D-manno-octulosonic-acid transferase